MNRRLSRWLGVLLLLTGLAVSSAQTTYAASGIDFFEGQAIPANSLGAGVEDRTNPVGVRARLSAPTTVTVPDIDTDGHEGAGFTNEAATVGLIMHIKNYCPTAGVVWGRIEGDPQVGKFVIYDHCHGAGSVLLYSQVLTDTTWRSRYIEDDADYAPFHTGWNDQFNADDEAIDVQMRRDSNNTSCIITEIYDFIDDGWDQVNSRCGVYTPGGALVDKSYWWTYMAFAGLEVWGQNGDLGSYGGLAMRNMQRMNASYVWSDLTSKDGDLRFPVTNWLYDSGNGLGPFTHPVIDEDWLFEWGADTQVSWGATEMRLCDKEHSTGLTGNLGDSCDYTLNHRDYTGTENLAFTTNNQLYNVNVQRAPTANDVLRPGDEDLAQNRTYYFKSNSWGAENGLFVDVAGLVPGTNVDITGQGYVLRGGSSGSAPTCSWVTSTKYSCTAAVGTALQEVYIKVKTKVVTVSGKSFTAGNSSNSRTWGGFSVSP